MDKKYDFMEKNIYQDSTIQMLVEPRRKEAVQNGAKEYDIVDSLYVEHDDHKKENPCYYENEEFCVLKDNSGNNAHGTTSIAGSQTTDTLMTKAKAEKIKQDNKEREFLARLIALLESKSDDGGDDDDDSGSGGGDTPATTNRTYESETKYFTNEGEELFIETSFILELLSFNGTEDEKDAFEEDLINSGYSIECDLKQDTINEYSLHFENEYKLSGDFKLGYESTLTISDKNDNNIGSMSIKLKETDETSALDKDKIVITNEYDKVFYLYFHETWKPITDLSFKSMQFPIEDINNPKGEDDDETYGYLKLKFASFSGSSDISSGLKRELKQCSLLLTKTENESIYGVESGDIYIEETDSSYVMRGILQLGGQNNTLTLYDSDNHNLGTADITSYIAAPYSDDEEDHAEDELMVGNYKIADFYDEEYFIRFMEG